MYGIFGAKGIHINPILERTAPESATCLCVHRDIKTLARGPGNIENYAYACW